MPDHSSPRRIDLVALAMCVLLPVLAYLPTLGYGFVFDDLPLLIENPLIRDPASLAEAFTTDLDPKARVFESATTNYLRPLFILLAAAIHDIAGTEPWGWHLVAVTLHGAICAIAFGLLRSCGLSTLSALLATLVFALHPAHVQSVAWVSGLQDLLMALLALLGGWALLRSARTDRPSPALLATLGLAYAGALLAKESSVGLAILASAMMVAPADGRFRSATRRPLAEMLTILAITLAYFAYRMMVLGELAHRFPTAPAIPEALASIPVALVAYLRDLVLPVDLFLLHPARPVSSWLAPPAIASAVAVLAAGLALLAVVRRRPTLAPPLIWMAAWLAPCLALWALNPEWMVMDRYLFLPTLGLGWVLAELTIGARPGRLPTTLLPASIIVVFAILSARDMRTFRNETSFWTAAIAADPGSSTAWAEWGRLRKDAGDLAEAITALERAIDLDPRAQIPRLRRALLDLETGRPALAVAQLEELVERNPSYLPAWRNLVVALDQAARPRDALATANQALARFPGDAVLWTHQAVLLRASGDPGGALIAIRKAAAIDSRDARLALREALLLLETGRSSEARAAALRGLALSPDPNTAAALARIAG